MKSGRLVDRLPGNVAGSTARYLERSDVDRLWTIDMGDEDRLSRKTPPYPAHEAQFTSVVVYQLTLEEGDVLTRIQAFQSKALELE